MVGCVGKGLRKYLVKSLKETSDPWCNVIYINGRCKRVDVLVDVGRQISWAYLVVGSFCPFSFSFLAVLEVIRWVKATTQIVIGHDIPLGQLLQGKHVRHWRFGHAFI